MLEEKYEIVMATEADREELLSLYRVQHGRKFCPWEDDYPSNETIDFDLSRDALFVMKVSGRIVAAISLDEDEAVNALACWDESLSPEGELSRIAVLPEEQSKGIGRIMMQYGMDELRRRGFRGIHILVNKKNIKALKCYATLDFNPVGECHLFNQDFYCYERKL